MELKSYEEYAIGVKMLHWRTKCACGTRVASAYARLATRTTYFGSVPGARLPCASSFFTAASAAAKPILL